MSRRRQYLEPTFNLLVQGWAFATPKGLLRRIELAEGYAASHKLTAEEEDTLNAMKETYQQQTKELT